MSFDFLCEVVIALCALECLPQVVKSHFLVRIEAESVHLVELGLVDVINVPVSKDIRLLLVLIFNTRLADDFLDPCGDLLDNLLLRLLFFLLFSSLQPRWCRQVKFRDRSQHESWQEVGVFAIACAILRVEPIGNDKHAEDANVRWENRV